MSASFYESIEFADGVEQLAEIVPVERLPVELGGSSEWSLDAYIAQRCRADGDAEEGGAGEVSDAGLESAVREYGGKRLDFSLLDRLSQREAS